MPHCGDYAQSGVILYGKTNNPQCMVFLETVSNMYGPTLNPWNTTLAAGGSSGGEASLIAQHGSPLGIASDIGGSIRVPVAFCGLYGFEPSGKRVPKSGWDCTMAGAESIMAVSGPIARSVQDQELFMQVTFDAKLWLKDTLRGVPLQSQTKRLETQKLTVGVMLWNEVVMPHPYITRVLREATQKLKQAGHEGGRVLTAVISFGLCAARPQACLDDILLPLYFTDGGWDITQTLAAGGEPMLPSAKKLISDSTVKQRSVNEVWKPKRQALICLRKLHVDRDEYRSEYLSKWAVTAEASKSGRPMDVLLCPLRRSEARRTI
ncbi:hypothetical protein LLEC1_04198 [Akanthomyces lecanii]|uniref:Amidase domain-containing protein n=1 Tax=Cordyceps confragosa TaxID=2714763 RepID=A0A179IF71_CORDF|nr:hypothetical protein LLEC1_04198 [Akanthomyces lecanii]